VGDQIGAAVGGTLQYVPLAEFQRIRGLLLTKVDLATLFAALCRINALYMIARAGSGHIGSSFSSLDIMTWLALHEVRSPAAGQPGPRDVFFSSKGHDAPALYSVMLALGQLDFELIHSLRRLGGLPGHPDVATPGIVTNTGSLGMGISKAKGMIFANRLLGREGNVFVLTGDGELQEGQIWESLVSAANHRTHELTVIVDHNKLQSDTQVARVSDLGDLQAKFEAFGWHVARCDGNDVAAFAGTLERVLAVTDRPKVVIADTVKGKGVSFMQHTSIDSDVEFYKFHSGAPSEAAYLRASQELIDQANVLLESAGAAGLQLETVTRPQAVQPESPQRLVQAYSRALLEHARRNQRIVALDADLVLDTGLIPFQHEFPARFVECGIAEQDMVSQAGGMALSGLLPIVHSFACFLSARPNEQIYNNATERSKIIYVGSLAGVVPGGPGHSHQSVRDISALGAVPGLIMMEPSCEDEVALLLDWCVNASNSSAYIRLVSLPWIVPYGLPHGYRPHVGRGSVLVGGTDVVVIGYGPVLLSAAVEAASNVARAGGLSVKVVNLPWLNRVDGDWLRAEIGACRNVISLDNHYAIGGQGDRIAECLAAGGSGVRLHRLTIDDVPCSGTNPEVLRAHRLDVDSLAEEIYRCHGRRNPT
jgi:transketolase